MLPHIFNGNGTISIMIDGKMKPVDTAHGNYEAIKNAIIACQWDIIPNLINIKEQVEEEANVGGVLATLKLIGDDKKALLILDKDLAARTFVAPIIG